jgi:hypothetical protein
MPASGISDDQRRRGQIVGAHIRVHPALEVAVAGQNRAGDQVVVVDGLGNRRVERAGVADAGGAAIAGQVEAERIEILLDIGLFQIVGHHLRARRQRGFHPRLDLQTFFERVSGNKTRADQNDGFEVLVQEVIAAITTSPSAEAVTV